MPIRIESNQYESIPEKIPKEINYIKQNHEIYSKWKGKLSHIKGLKIGINWQGNKNYKYAYR